MAKGQHVRRPPPSRRAPRPTRVVCRQTVAVLSVLPRLADVLSRARHETAHPPVTWLEMPPSGLHVVHARVQVTGGASLVAAGEALRQWVIHRSAGLLVESDGPARAGGTVVLGMRVGPLWAIAPCRVVALVDEPGRVGFTYATLPGHPELGVESFVFERENASGVLWFRVDAVSRPAQWMSRLAPYAARRVQGRITGRYLAAAQAVTQTS